MKVRRLRPQIWRQVSNGDLAEVKRLQGDDRRAARIARAMTNMTAAFCYIDSQNRR
jgi:hypothetical protein